MLCQLGNLLQFRLRAFDGEFGAVEDFHFDDEHWIIRYLVASTRTWMLGRDVLISPSSIGEILWNQRVVQVLLTREQIERSPAPQQVPQVARDYESKLASYYGWPAYWMAGALRSVPAPPADATAQVPEAPPQGPTLRRGGEVIGYRIEAADGHVGHVKDFIFNDVDYRISHLLIDTREILPGRNILLPVGHVRGIDGQDKRIDVSLPRRKLKDAPRHQSDDLGEEYLRDIEEYYGPP